MKETYYVNQQETQMRSSIEKKVNAHQKDQKEKMERVSTDEGKAEAMAFIFGTED